jgi:hypothetical protein
MSVVAATSAMREPANSERAITKNLRMTSTTRLLSASDSGPERIAKSRRSHP